MSASRRVGVVPRTSQPLLFRDHCFNSQNTNQNSIWSKRLWLIVLSIGLSFRRLGLISWLEHVIILFGHCFPFLSLSVRFRKTLVELNSPSPKRLTCHSSHVQVFSSESLHRDIKNIWLVSVSDGPGATLIMIYDDLHLSGPPPCSHSLHDAQQCILMHTCTFTLLRVKTRYWQNPRVDQQVLLQVSAWDCAAPPSPVYYHHEALLHQHSRNKMTHLCMQLSPRALKCFVPVKTNWNKWICDSSIGFVLNQI